MEQFENGYIREMAEVLTDAVETILTTQDCCEEMDVLLTQHGIRHTGAPDSCALIHLTARLAQLRTFLLSDVCTALNKQE